MLKTRRPEYKCWQNMKSRCRNPNFPQYPDYGAIGVTVCDRWNEFDAFLEDVGPRPSLRHSLDRYPDGDGNYEPGNVRWATPGEQLINRSNNILLTIDGVTKPYIEWERESGLPKRLIYARIFLQGWDPARAVRTPKGRYEKSGLYIDNRGTGLPTSHKPRLADDELPDGVAFGRPQNF